MPTRVERKDADRHISIFLTGKRRDDGSLFVTSSNLPHFSAVLENGEWEDVSHYLKIFLEANVGKVRRLQIIHDAAELFQDSKDNTDSALPTYVIAEVSRKNAGSMRARSR